MQVENILLIKRIKMPHNVDITIDAEKLKGNPILPEVSQILRLIRPGWPNENIRFKRFTGGIANIVYGYYEEGKFDEDCVLFRINGEKTELTIDRPRELENIQAVHAAGCCAPLYVIFNNGIVYGYINGENLDENTVRDKTVRRLIAKEFCRLHMVRPEGQEPVSEYWGLVDRLLDLSPDGFPDDLEKQKRYVSLIQPKQVLKEELDELRKHLEALNSPIVFCHNDPVLGNIIYNKQKGKIHFIDYEYAMYNYEHFDVVSHFCEDTAPDDVKFDLSRYPDKAYQEDWIQYYLECKAELNGKSPADVTDRDVEDFYVKANKFALLAIYVAAVWALSQAKVSKIDFDFIGFAKCKLDLYFALKDEFMNLQLPN